MNGSDEQLGTAADAGEFTIAAAYGEDGHSATYTVTGPFQNNTNYQLRYPTRFAASRACLIRPSWAASTSTTSSLTAVP